MTEQAPVAPGTEEKSLEAVEAEARGRRQADGSVLVPLVVEGQEDVDIRILAPTEWYEGAVDALRAGQITKWVELSTEPADAVLWRGRRKRYRHLDAFLAAWTKATGESPGESPGSSTS